MDEVTSRLDRLNEVLDEGCAACQELQARGGGRCSLCESSLDVRESLTGCNDKRNYLRLSSAFAMFETGHWEYRRFADVTDFVRGCIARAARMLAMKLAEGRSQIPERTYRLQLCMEEMVSIVDACVKAARSGDLPLARHHIESIRFAMYRLDEINSEYEDAAPPARE